MWRFAFYMSLMIAAAYPCLAQIPMSGLAVWWRADRGVAVTGDLVTSWESGDLLGGLAVPVGESHPRLVEDAVNGRPAVRFDASASQFLEGPSRFPVSSDYTIYAVVRVNNAAAAGNILSGNTRAFWLGSTDRPRVMHGADFSNVAISDLGAGVGSFVVVRVEYRHAVQRATIHINNAEGCGATYVPSNSDAKIVLGAYQQGNFLSADIAEVAVYGRVLTAVERQEADAELHGRYGIPRASDPPPPAVVFDVVPKPLALYAVGQELVCAGTVSDGALRSIHVHLDSAGSRIGTWTFDVRSNKRFSAQRALTPGLHTYRCTVTGEHNAGTDTIHRADDIVCGEVIAIEGQSNAIWPDPTIPFVPWARTFGSNNGDLASDTVFKHSVSVAAGGGANVGAIGIYLQQAFARELSTPTCVINGGVGGTRIEQHYPNAGNRFDRSTIYGSWAYRLKHSGLAPFVRLLIWYQGESNGGGDRYGELFDKLQREWREDLPNLERIIVVQIRPGCGLEQHARLRHDQAQLGTGLFPDVYVHAAAGLPGHDGCHYAPVGYQELGRQLMDIISANRTTLGDGFVGTAPYVEEASAEVTPQGTTVRLQFARATSLRFTADTAAEGEIRYTKDAFFANGNEVEHPTSVRVNGSLVELLFPAGVQVARVSYVPDTYYPGTQAVYQGPWLVTDAGVGALTFHNIPVTTTAVADQSRRWASWAGMLVVRSGDALRTNEESGTVRIVDLRGAVAAIAAVDQHGFVVPSLPPGIYVVDGGKGQWLTVVP